MATKTNNQNWHTIHIFGYGETQLNGGDLCKKYLTSDLTKVQDVIDNILSLKPTDLQLTDFHCINIFKEDKVVFMSKETIELNFTIDYAELDSLKIEALTQEIIDRPTNQEETITLSVEEQSMASSEETTTSSEVQQ